MDAAVEQFPEGSGEGKSLEDDLLEESWKLYHSQITAVQRDIHLLRSAVVRRLGEWGMTEFEKDPPPRFVVMGWLQQQTRALESNLRNMFLCAMRSCAFERAARAQAIRKYCDARRTEGQP